MTKPFNLLRAAGVLLADSTNAVATEAVAPFIQPVIDVLRLADEPRELSAGFLITGALTYRFRHGPVRQSEVWEYEEMTLFCGTITGTANFNMRVILASNIGTYFVASANLVNSGASANFMRSKNTLAGAAVDQRGVSSDRPLRLYPGEILEIESDLPMTAADSITISGLYVRKSAPQPDVALNNNADNVVVEEF